MSEATYESVGLREYFERILEEKHSAISLAEQEREKAAAALRASLEREIIAGDARLQDHVIQQVEQVRAALLALQELLNERNARMDDRFGSHREAIQKAEDSMNKRLLAMNEFRDQLASQAATFATREALDAASKQLSVLIDRNREDLAEQRGVYLRVAAFDAALKELTTWRTKVDVRDAEQQTNVISRRTLDDILAPLVENVAALQRWQFKIAGALVLITVVLPGLVAFGVYLLTRTAVPIDGLK